MRKTSKSGASRSFLLPVTDFEPSLSLSTFTLGALPRRLVAAIILEGLSVLGLMQFTSSGPRFLGIGLQNQLLAAITGMAAALLAFYFSYRIARFSFSPTLHRPFVPLLIAIGYLLLGMVIMGAAFAIDSAISGHSPIPNPSEAVFGLSLGSVLGFFVLLYIDRFEIETPDNREKFDTIVATILENHAQIESSEKAPIQLTGSYDSLADSIETASDLLDESMTNQGDRLKRSIQNWVETFREKPEVTQAVIVDSSRSPVGQELTELQNQFEEIIEHLKRLSNNE